MVKKKTNIFETYQHYITPSVIGGLIAGVFSGSLFLALAVFISVWVGNWIGYELLRQK